MIRRLSILLVYFGVLGCCINVDLDQDRKPNFQVIRAKANDMRQLESLKELHDANRDELDFWLKPSKIGHKADIMVEDGRMPWLIDTLRADNISYHVMIDNVEKRIVEKERKPRKLSSFFGKRMHNEGGNRARYPFGEYQNYQVIVDWMKDIEAKYPQKAKVFSIGTTAEGRSIYGIKIGKDVWRNDKRVFWIDGGIHAREWAAVHTTLWFIDRLIADYDDDLIVRNAVDRLNFYIIPVANPDGYEYSRSDVSPMIRLWRKNRAGVICKKDRWFRDRCCGGVDLNRNFDWFFGETGSSTDKCSEIYQGSGAFSEAESRAIRDIHLSQELRGKVDAFITLHTYSQMWIHPYSHARKAVPNDVAELQRVGREAVAALENTFGTKYKFGTGSDILYPSSGGSDDWAKGKLAIKYVYLLELRPGEDVWDGFILDQHQLVPTAKETWNGIKVVIRTVSDQAAIPATPTLPPVLLLPTVPTTTEATTIWTTPSTTTPSTIAPTLLDAVYKLGKRRFKFVSIKTFHPTTPMPFFTTTTTTITPFIDTNNNHIEFEGVALMRPAFVRRPSQQQQQLQNRPLQQQQQLTLRRNNNTRRPFAFRRGGLGTSQVVNNVAQRPLSTPRCIDRSTWCLSWISANPRVCQVSSIYMRQDCARTCRFCQ